MGDAGMCGRCGGKGWRWTGQARVPCTCPGAVRPPPDPVTTGFDLIPVDRWLARPGHAPDRRHR